MLSPVIVVGCGGSGVKSVRYVREAVKARLASNGWTGPMPQAWQFIGLDTLNSQTDLAEVPALPSRDYQSVTGGFAKLNELYGALRAAHGPERRGSGYRELLGWLPDSNEVNGDLRIGAGGLRAVGRALGAYTLNSDAVKSRLVAAYSACAGGAPELLDVCRALGLPVDPAAAVPQPLVVVIGSVAGGTGAGVMLDTLDMLKRVSTIHTVPIAIVYGPDIFGDQMVPEMVSNGLAAMSEMMNAFWSEGPGPEGLFPAPGIDLDSRGPHAIFSVSRENMSGVDLKNASTIYRAVGDALSSWVTSPRISTVVRDYVMGNRDVNVQLGGMGFGEGDMRGAITSFGSATVAVGRTRFRTYAKAFLMRNFYDFHWGGVREVARRILPAGEASKPDNVVIDALAKHFFPQYLLESGLKQAFEDGLASSGITDVVMSLSHSEKVGRDFEMMLHDRLPTTATDSNGWRDHVSNFASLLRPDHLRKANSDFEERLNEWLRHLAERILNRTNLLIAEASLPVAIRVVELTINELQQYANQYRQSAEIARGRSNSMIAEMWQKISSITGSPKKDAGGVREACVYAGINLAQESRVEGFSRLERVIGEIERNLMGQLRLAMQTAKDGDLTKVNTMIDSTPAIVTQWPREREVPEPFKPTMVEFLLEGWEQWPDILREIVRECVDRRPTDADDFEAFRRAITLGDADNPLGRPPLLWQEDNRLHDWSIHQPFKARMSLDPESVDNMVSAWMNISTPMANHLSQGLATYLGDKGQVARFDAFRTQFRYALQQSKPLIKVDQIRLQQELARIGGEFQPLGVRPVIDQLPFNSGHPARELAEELLRSELGIGPTENMDTYFTNVDKEAAVMSNFLEKSIHPSFAMNFTLTVAQTLQPLQQSVALREWFKFKRARTLNEFVPVSEPIFRAIIRGFVVARLIGQVTVDTTRPIRVAVDEEVHEFPFPLLSPVESTDVLAGILESMPLTFGKFPAEGMNAYAAYGALYRHGVPFDGPFAVGGGLAEFLRTGAVPGRVLDEARMLEFSGSSFAERQQKMVDFLNGIIDYYLQLKSRPLTGKEMRRKAGTVDPPETITIEIIADLLAQYEIVRNAIQEASEDPTVRITTAPIP